jgi:hypothetical protein
MAHPSLCPQSLLLSLPLELRLKIWELALDATVTFKLPNIYLVGHSPDELFEYDKYGEGSPGVTDFFLRTSYLTELTTYLDNTPPHEWDSRMPKCRNFFYKRFANLDIRLVNKQVHSETSLVLSRLNAILRNSVFHRHLSYCDPAFPPLLSRTPIYIDSRGYHLISFLQTTSLSTLSSIRSIFLDREFVQDWDQGIVEEIWRIPDNHQYETTGQFGLTARLLDSRLPSLEEVAIWAPISSGVEEEYNFVYPADFLRDLWWMVEKGRIRSLQILFKVVVGQDHADLGSLHKWKVAENEDHWDGKLEFPEWLRGIAYDKWRNWVLQVDEKECNAVARKWKTKGVKAVTTFTTQEIQKIDDDDGKKSSFATCV